MSGTTNAAQPLFKGHPVQLGGVAYVMPALSFGGLDLSKDRMRQIDAGEIVDPFELQAAFVEILHLALQRNYPDLPQQVVIDALDWELAVSLYRTLVSLSFPRALVGEPRVESPSGASTGN